MLGGGASGGGENSEVAAWPDDKDRTKAQWRMIPVDVHTDTFMLQSVRFEEYLYSADYAKFKKDSRGRRAVESSRGGRRVNRPDPLGSGSLWR